MSAPTPRYTAVDFVRGFIMIVMALDHVRDYLSVQHFDPTDLSQTTPVLFFTRWITHYCAPTFCFLAGTSAYLQRSRKSTAELSRFLLTRGLWLIVLEFTVIRFAWEFDLDYHMVILLVIWMLGCSMVVLAGLVHLPVPVVVAVGAVLVLGHNAFDTTHFGGAAWWQILHEAFQPFPLDSNVPPRIMLVVYPLIPWPGVMALGYGLGAIVTLPEAERQRWLWRLGTAVCVLFIVLRLSNWYGDAHPWSPQASGLLTVLSFLNTTKYPPSLLYLSMTLGPAVLLLAAAAKWHGRAARMVEVIGRVPTFYYVVHLFLIHFIASLAALPQYGLGAFQALHIGGIPEGFGFGLPVVYATWVVAIALLYPACVWFDGVKQRRRDLWWLSYL